MRQSSTLICGAVLVGGNSYSATVQSDLSYSVAIPGSVLAANAAVAASVTLTVGDLMLAMASDGSAR